MKKKNNYKSIKIAYIEPICIYNNRRPAYYVEFCILFHYHPDPAMRNTDLHMNFFIANKKGQRGKRIGSRRLPSYVIKQLVFNRDQFKRIRKFKSKSKYGQKSVIIPESAWEKIWLKYGDTERMKKKKYILCEEDVLEDD